jgi:preprotein translocase subunit SecE
VVAEKLDDINVSEEEPELEAETSSVPESLGGEPPTRTKSSAAASGGGGRGGKHREVAPGFFARLGQFIRDTRAEMRRVSWPTANEVKNTTIITLIAVIFFALYLFGVDRVLAYAIDHLFTWLGGRA